MTIGSHRQHNTQTFYWPGFVDAMATLILVIIFLLSIFMIAQFFLAREISDQDSALETLRNQISELTEILNLEKANADQLQQIIATLSEGLAISEDEKKILSQQIIDINQQNEKENKQNTANLTTLEGQLEKQKKTSTQAQAQIELLNQQIAALRQQLRVINETLRESEEKYGEAQEKISDLGKRLNLAFIQKIKELEKFRSEFFTKLSTILAERSDIKVEGDRFIFQAELLFPKAEADINEQGKIRLNALAQALLELEQIIPKDINWILRVDGHTDSDPIQTPQFPSNWELSTARAISVVRYLIDNGVPKNRLAATGFAEFQPIALGEDEQTLRKKQKNSNSNSHKNKTNTKNKNIILQPKMQ